MVDQPPIVPVQGPLSAEKFFALRPPIEGIRPCKRLALGTAYLGRTVESGHQEDAIQTLHDAWRDGFELVDTAPGYGNAEHILSAALAGWRGPRPIVATKTTQHSSELAEVVHQFHTSGRRLGEIDMLAVHDADADYSDEARTGIASFVRQLLEQGQTRAAGIGGGGPRVQAQWLPEGIFGYIITYMRVDALTLQGLKDTIPQARQHNAAVFAATPLHLGLLGPHFNAYVETPPPHLAPVFLQRARHVKKVSGEWGVPLSHLALRFVLSMPSVDVVLTGAATPQEWADCRQAYEAGPLPVELYTEIWNNAQRGVEPLVGG